MPRKPHKYHYIYKTTCTKTGKFYIGMHSTSTDPESDDYLGSGVHLRRSVRKWGRENHIKEILELCDNRTVLKEREAIIANRETIQDPQCMNIRVGGGGFDENQRIDFKGWESANKYWKTEEGKEKLRLIGAKSKGRTYKLKTKRKTASVTTKGYLWMHHKGLQKTVTVKPEQKEEFELEGYQTGRLSLRVKNPVKRVWIHKGDKSTLVEESNLNSFLTEGWTRGMKRK